MSRLPARVLLPSGERPAPTEAAAETGAGRSPPGCRSPRHAPQASLRAHLVAKTFRPMTKNSAIAKAVALFLAGAEGLGLACRLGCCSPVGSAQHRPGREPRPVRGGAPLALAHPSARGFGVDVETAHRERGRDKVAPFYQPSHKTGGAGLVLSEKTSGSSVLSAICHRMIASICDLYYNITKQDRLAYVERISCELLLRILRALPMFQRME